MPVARIASRKRGEGKELLTRDAILAAALELLRRDGMEGFSLRKVATALNTGPASLYVHLRDWDELLSLVLDRALAGVRMPRDGTRWDKAIEQIALSYLRVLYRHPGVASLAISTVPLGPNNLRITEALLELLQRAGCSNRDAAWGADLILHYAASTAAEQRGRGANVLKEVTRALKSLDAATYPRLTAMRGDLLSGGIDRFLWGLRAVVRGITARPRR